MNSQVLSELQIAGKRWKVYFRFDVEGRSQADGSKKWVDRIAFAASSDGAAIADGWEFNGRDRADHVEWLPDVRKAWAQFEISPGQWKHGARKRGVQARSKALRDYFNARRSTEIDSEGILSEKENSGQETYGPAQTHQEEGNLDDDFPNERMSIRGDSNTPADSREEAPDIAFSWAKFKSPHPCRFSTISSTVDLIRQLHIHT